MSQYGIIYRMEFLNADGYTVRVNISPTDVLIDDADTPAVIELTGGDTPVIISASDNNEDKLSPIRSKSAKIQFRTDSGAGLNSATFSQGGDNLWVCDIILQDTPEYIFRGFLMMADNQQPFQPDPQYVTLTATDHLAALREVAWVDLADENPVGKYRVASCLAYALRKTGLSLNIKVVNNLRAGSGQFTMSTTFLGGGANTLTVADTKMFYPGQHLLITGTVSNNGALFVESVDSSTQITVINSIISEGPVSTTITDYNSQYHWYDKVYLDARTFEKEIGLSEDCHTVISKILGEDCFITQWKGEWWIFRVDEMEDNPVYVATFDSNGLYVSTAVGTQYDKDIGRVEVSKFANADTLLRFIRPHGFIKETFNYEIPLEVPCNIDFGSGTLLSSSDTFKTYSINCWDKLYKDGTGDHPSAATIIIEAQLRNGREYNRYVKFYDNGVFNFIMSEAIPVNINDKFNIGVTRRMESNHASGGTDNCVQVRLYGDDGTYWTHHGRNTSASPDAGVAYWKSCDSLFQTNQKFFPFEIPNNFDDTESINLYDGEGAQIPVSGYLKFLIYTSALYGGTEDCFIEKATFEYIPYIAGSYQLYSGQYSQIDRTESGYFANRDQEVFISDSPTKIFKGAMFLLNNSSYVLFPTWFNAATNGGTYTGLPSTDYLHPYGYIQAYSVWNQFKGYNTTTTPVRGIGINIFQGSVKGLSDDWPDLIHRFTLTDANAQTNNRYFLLISLEQDWKSCIWTATFIEVYNRVIYKSYSDVLTFKFISQ